MNNANKYRCDLTEDMRMMIFIVQSLALDHGEDVSAQYILEYAITTLFKATCDSNNINTEEMGL